MPNGYAFCGIIGGLQNELLYAKKTSRVVRSAVGTAQELMDGRPWDERTAVYSSRLRTLSATEGLQYR